MRTQLRIHLEEITTLTDDEFNYIFSHFSIKKLKKHQFLIQEDDEVSHTYWVNKGLLKAYITDKKGKDYILNFAMENWWISDFQAYFTQAKATLNVSCLEDTELLCLSFDNREKLCAEMHKMEHFFRKKANSGFVSLQKRMLSFLTQNTKERYDILLNQYPQLFQRVPKTIIAAYLGVSRETLSRLSSQ
jgi:CRP-like cAMP-binding protein